MFQLETNRSLRGMGIRGKTFRIMMAIATIASSVTVDAAIRPTNVFRHFEIIDAKTKELNLSLLEKIERFNSAYRFDMGDYIPYRQMNDTDSAEKVANRILRHSVQNWLDDSDFVKESNVARSAASLNAALSPQVKSSNFSFRIKPIDTKAEITYSGAVKATLSYVVDDQELNLGISWTF